MGSLKCDLDTVHGRLKSARLEAGLSQEETAELVGLTKGGISQMEQGRRPISKRHARMMALMLRISEDWLWKGKGEKLLDFNHYLKLKLLEQWGLSTEEATLVVNFVSAPPEQRKAIFNVLDTINNWRSAPENE